MKLWVDGQALQSGSAYRGIGRYIIELLKAIVKHYPDVKLHISFNAALPTELIAARFLVADWIAAENIHVWHGAVKAGEGIEGFSVERHFSEIMLAHHVASISPDIAFSVSPFEGGVDLCVPLVDSYGHDFLIASIFYDAIPLRYPEKYLTSNVSLEYYARRLKAHSNFDMNLSISDFSDRELRELTGSESSVAIHAGLSTSFETILRDQSKNKDLKPIIDVPYTLYVGGLDWRKNVELIIEAFSLSDDTIKNELSFVIAGDTHEREKSILREQWSAAKLEKSKLIIIDRVTDDELVNLYTHAKFSIQPSYMEGFGLTVLESIACRTPVLASNRGALPEVLGGNSCFFDPSSALELSELFKRMDDPQVQVEMLEIADQCKKRYSWEYTASLAIGALKSILGKPKKANSISQRDSITVRAVMALNLKRNFIAEGLSLATPPPQEPGRILLDTTSTAKNNHGTGIQRVVMSIAKHALKNEQYKANTQLIFCDDKVPFVPIQLDSKGILKIAKGAKHDPIIFRSNDIILMLDSSWEFHDIHKQLLNNPKMRGTKIYSVLYDMVPLLTPGLCDQGMSIVFSNWIKDALEYSDGFICISKAVADEFHALLKAIKFPRPMKVGYWHLGADFTQTEMQPDTRGNKKNKKNYLMVGTLEPRKGHKVAIKAFTPLWAQGNEITLTIVGKKGWAVDALIQSIKSHPEYNKKLFWYSDVDDNQLAKIYKKSDVLIAASFAEGFGLPIIEAANLNIPIIASDIPVFREVASGHDVRFFNCGQPDSLSQVIKEYNEFPNNGWDETEKPEILTWVASTNELLKVMNGENWYKEYTPVAGVRFNEGDVGDMGALDVIPLEGRHHNISIVDGPYPSDHADKMTCLIKLVNLSEMCWSSEGPDGTHEMGVAICARLRDGRQLIDNGIRVRIPLTIIPQTPYHFAIELPKEDLLAGKAYEIELLQEGVNWWGDGVVVELLNNSI